MANNYGFKSVNRQVGSTKGQSNEVFDAIERVNQKMIYARVTDIILNDQHPKFREFGGWSSIGTIFYEKVEVADNNISSVTSALPLIPYLKNYPLVNEFVLLFLLPTKGVSEQSNITSYFYLNPISIWNNQHLNAFPNLNTSTTQDSEQKSYQAIEDGQTRKSSTEEVNYSYNSPLIGGTFEERSNIHPLLAFAGDIITEGRWGNSIRLGSTALTSDGIYNNNWSSNGSNGNPITIIRNGQPTDSSDTGFTPIIEDINKDLSSIYLTSNQEIPLKTTITNNPSIRDNSLESLGSYQGSQVMLNSSRLVFNANSTGSMLLNSEGAISLTSVYTVGIYSQEGDISLQSGRGTIRLGDYNANQSIILGDNFMFDFQDLLKKLRNLCQLLVGEPELVLSTGAAGSVKTTINLMLDNIDSYTSKIVKSI
jgi:hypothetical protein